MVNPGDSPFVTSDPVRHAAALGTIDPEEVHEFYSPFAMVPDVAELVRVINPTYGEMDMVVLLDPRPVTVYVNSATGERFLKERFPNARRFRVPGNSFVLEESDRGHVLTARLTATAGPLRQLELEIRMRADATYATERYESLEVWGSPLTCHGIDMRAAATAKGTRQTETGPKRRIDTEATIFRGSYGRIAPRRVTTRARVAAPRTR